MLICVLNFKKKMKRNIWLKIEKKEIWNTNYFLKFSPSIIIFSFITLTSLSSLLTLTNHHLFLASVPLSLYLSSPSLIVSPSPFTKPGLSPPYVSLFPSYTSLSTLYISLFPSNACLDLKVTWKIRWRKDNSWI